MAMPPNKSSSSPIASKSNPNLRNSEIGNPMRRSFTGNSFAKPSINANPRSFNPNTPANSPSENLRRSSMGRATVVTFRDSEDKENGKDQNWKQMRVRSPSGSNGTKNFMSPTISAASKVTTSPRKKILAERNEPVRASSVSFSDLKSSCLNPRVEDPEHTKVGLAPHLVFTTPKTQKDIDSKELLCSKNEPEEEPVCVKASDEPDSVNLDPSFKISPPPCCPKSSPVIAPLDDDPAAHPYDPKTNYLSPRPQFLHYRPNPRIEYYLSKEREGKRLEDNFISGSSSDTDTTEETQSEYSQKELEDVTSDAVVKEEQQLPEENAEEEEEEEKQGVNVSEPCDISITNTFMSKEEGAEVKWSSKTGFFWKSKFTALLLLLVVAFWSISVIHSPVIDSSVLKDLSFLKEYDHSEVAEFARSSLDGLARNFRVWSANSVSFISELILHLRGAHDLAPLQYCNLTALMEDVRVDGYSVFDHSDKGMERKYEFDVVDIEALGEKGRTEIGAAENTVEVYADPEYDEQVNEEAETPVEIQVVEEKGQPEIGAVESTVEVVRVDPEHEEQVDQEAEAAVNIEEVSEGNNNFISEEVVLQAAHADLVELESSKVEQSQEENVGADHIDSEPESNVSMREEIVLISLAEKVDTVVSGIQELESEMSTGAEVESFKDHSPISSKVDASCENVQTSEEVDLTVDETEFKVSMVTMLGIALLVSALIGSTAFIYGKKRKSTASNPAISVVQPSLTRKLDASPTVPFSTEHTFQERPSSWNWIGEPCPSEMSNIQKSSSYRTKGLKAFDKAESQEMPRKNHRRESLTSIDSSMGSPSYGSFTTYEKIPIKHGEEEIVTPVRRSSRIRKQVTSP
ncbi:hypothetical protein PRUPE_8G151700 [Prunus persica]|uniref:Uncharacterized protein n=1 Tax=Prunus persica TaxID=3760 RepID=A0A251MYD7_PRUPE|nr:uncharacterized protein LOC18767080 [Prunus persica]ONH92063.1 hypothetical protein PRUPE_8G151700 [Prunus persica]